MSASAPASTSAPEAEPASTSTAIGALESAARRRKVGEDSPSRSPATKVATGGGGRGGEDEEEREAGVAGVRVVDAIRSPRRRNIAASASASSKTPPGLFRRSRTIPSSPRASAPRSAPARARVASRAK